MHGAYVFPCDPTITRLDVSAYTIPTDYPEAEGTLERKRSRIWPCWKQRLEK